MPGILCRCGCVAVPDEREAMVITLRYGLKPPPLTQREIAAKAASPVLCIPPPLM